MCELDNGLRTRLVIHISSSLTKTLSWSHFAKNPCPPSLVFCSAKIECPTFYSQYVCCYTSDESSKNCRICNL